MSVNHILIIEDDLDIAELIENHLISGLDLPLSTHVAASAGRGCLRDG